MGWLSWWKRWQITKGSSAWNFCGHVESAPNLSILMRSADSGSWVNILLALLQGIWNPSKSNHYSWSVATQQSFWTVCCPIGGNSHLITPPSFFLLQQPCSPIFRSTDTRTMTDPLLFKEPRHRKDGSVKCLKPCLYGILSSTVWVTMHTGPSYHSLLVESLTQTESLLYFSYPEQLPFWFFWTRLWN